MRNWQVKKKIQFRTPAELGFGRSKLGVPGHIHPEIKGQWLNLIFFDFRGGEFGLFSDLSLTELKI